jgi:hypothetical protein
MGHEVSLQAAAAILISHLSRVFQDIYCSLQVLLLGQFSDLLISTIEESLLEECLRKA